MSGRGGSEVGNAGLNITSFCRLVKVLNIEESFSLFQFKIRPRFKIYFKGTAMVVVNANGRELELPVGMAIEERVLEGGMAYVIEVKKKEDAALVVE